MDHEIFPSRGGPYGHQEYRRHLQDALAADRPSDIIPQMKKAICEYIGEVNTGREILSPRDVEFLESFFTALMVERTKRAEEVESPEVCEAAEIANGLFPYPPLLNLCVDGRINPTLVFGMFANMQGGAIQTPAGDSNDYVRGSGGTLRIRKRSNMYRQLNHAFERHGDIVEVLDSHVACAARCGDCQKQGLHELDDGLLMDVLRKKEIAAAMREYRHPNAKYADKKIMPIQVSFDPHHGFCYMGLESDHALEYAKSKGGLTNKNPHGESEIPNVLDDLVKEGRILSTQQLAEEFADIFTEYYERFDPPPDWKEQYSLTALQLWRALAEMKSKLLPKITARLVAKNGPFPGGCDPQELEQRAVLLLASAFNGFCNNRRGHYEFGEHTEEFVSGTERDYRPCRTMGFAVYSLDLANLSRNVEFASTIVRANREKSRIKSDVYRNVPEFEAAPVPVVIKEIVRAPLSEEEWRKLHDIDWSFLDNLEDGRDWRTLKDEEFLELLDQHTNISLKAANALQRLRHKMQAMYDPHKPSSPLLIEGKLFALPILSDKSRRFRAVVPFFVKEIHDE